MDKENVVYTYSGIVLSPKKERNLAICYNTYEARGHFPKGNKPVTEEQILLDSTHVRCPK